MDDPNRTSEPALADRMRRDWNERAGEDAHYYVAFGRRGQDDEEFFATAGDALRALEPDLKRLSGGDWTALEIGCGPGRLMRPMSRHFREIHGVDVSDEMIRLARRNLAGLPNAHVHASSGEDLSGFSSGSFDFVYSYAVFQHIPSRDVVLRYLREARRVLRPGGILRCQINGLPEQAARYTTWEGVRIPAAEVADFARAHDLQLLALEGASTQYMWVTCRKRPAGWRAFLAGSVPPSGVRVRNVTNARTGEPVAPACGSLAVASLWVEHFPADCDLLDLDVSVDGRSGVATYIGAPAWDDVTQVNVALPDGTRTGLVPLEMRWLGRPLAPPGWLRVVPAVPYVPRLTSVSDGVNLLAGPRIESRIVKVVLEEVRDIGMFRAAVDGMPVENVATFCTDPGVPRYEVNFQLPPAVGSGRHELRVGLGKRGFAPVWLEVD